MLERLGFFVAGQGERVKIAVPSWRADVRNKADIVEEVVRIVGVDRVPLTPFPRGDNPRKPMSDRDPGAHPQGQARARRAQFGRGGHVVFHRQSRRRNSSAAASRSSRSPIRSPPSCPICGRASFRASLPPRKEMPIAASLMSACSKSARFFAAISRRISSPPLPECGVR